MPDTLAIIGVGAFGRFMIPHLAPHFAILAHEPAGDISDLCARHGISSVSFEAAASAGIVVLAVPIAGIGPVAKRLAPHVRHDALVIDVCSVKVEPLRLLREILPPGCAIVGTHALFGPNSAATGIAGRKVSVCEVRGGRGECVAAFLRDRLALDVIETTPEEHDRQLAIAQGLTHLVGRIVAAMGLPRIEQTTAAYDHLSAMADIVAGISDDLARAIAEGNPHVAEVRRRFFDAVAALEKTDQ